MVTSQPKLFRQADGRERIRSLPFLFELPMCGMYKNEKFRNRENRAIAKDLEKVYNQITILTT